MSNVAAASMTRLAASVLLASSCAACSNTPSMASTATVDGQWGGGSRTLGTSRLDSCDADGVFATTAMGLGFCDLVQVGEENRLGLSLTQDRDTVKGTVFYSGAHAMTGVMQAGSGLTLHGSWNQYPGDPNPIAGALLRTINWNATIVGDAMSGTYTVRDTFAAGSDFTGSLTLRYRLANFNRD
jgi:hypothetical protein